MRTLLLSAVLLTLGLPRSADAEPRELGQVSIEVSNPAPRVPGLVGVTIRLRDQAGRPLSTHSLPPSWTVLVTRDGAPLWLELTPVDSGRVLEGELPLRRPGRARLRARVDADGQTLGESEAVTVTATAPVDFGQVRAGETVCRQLPGGGRGIAGVVIEGELPRGLRLWGGCLVADDSAAEAAGTFVARIAVQNGRQVDRGEYEISYRLVPRLLTPRRSLWAFAGLSVLVMIALVVRASRRRRPSFGPGVALAFAEVERSPYRGDRPPVWRVVPLEQAGSSGGVVDLGLLLGGAAIGAGQLRIAAAEGGLVEFVGPRGEELRAATPDHRVEVGVHRLVVPYGSILSFRSLVVAPLIGDQAEAAGRGSTEFLVVPSA